MKKKILLIQSTQTQGNGTKRHLEDRGYKVVWAGSGLTALMLARNMTIDLILLDVALPDIEGMDLCRRFRQRSDTQGIPIILLTARGYRPEKSTGAKYRPDACLAKPFAESELDERISSLLAGRTAAVRDKKAAVTPQPAPALMSVVQ
jgi:DNA-binding response OmpR family regulator